MSCRFLPKLALPALLLLVAGPSLSAQQVLADQWYAILLGGTRVGYLHQRTTVEADGALRTDTVQQMAVRRYGEPFTVRQEDTWLEDQGLGALRALHSRLNTNGQLQDLDVRRTSSGLEVRLQREGRESLMHIQSCGDLLGPALAARAVADALSVKRSGSQEPPPLAEPLHYLTFSPESLAVVQVEVRLLGEGELRDTLGAGHRGLLAEERSSALPGIATRQVYSAAGRLLYSHTAVGVPVETIPVAQLPEGAEELPEGAEELRGAVPFEIATLNIPVAGLDRLQGPAELLRGVTLRFTGPALDLLRGHLETAAASPGAPIEVGNRVNPEGLVPDIGMPPGLEVRLSRPEGAPPGPKAPPAVLAQEEASGFLRDGFYLDLEDPRLEQLLASCPAARPGEPDDAWLACLERAVDRYLQRKSLDWGFAGVSEILTARAGDCSALALLLAALLRRSGVPARLAYGFLFTEAGFVGHAWTEAWVGGTWRWLDPSFPGGRPYGLKLPLGNIDPAEPLGARMGLTLLQLAGGVRAQLIEAR